VLLPEVLGACAFSRRVCRVSGRERRCLWRLPASASSASGRLLLVLVGRIILVGRIVLVVLVRRLASATAARSSSLGVRLQILSVLFVRFEVFFIRLALRDAVLDGF
jgi:hypothetical protein